MTTVKAAVARRPIAAPADSADAADHDQRPVEVPRPTEASPSRPVSDDDPSTDVRREEHKKIVPFQFHRVSTP